MCGIAGILIFDSDQNKLLEKIDSAIDCLSSRGPDDKGTFKDDKVALGHRRLSVIDTSHDAAQPMADPTGRYRIIFNGEFFNYKEHRAALLEKGIKLKTKSDTEVLLQLYILESEKFLEKINGFFALAIYDTVERVVFLARDRFGVKPLLIYEDGDTIMFASEMKALFQLGIKKEIDEASLFTYLQLNYIPAPYSILRGVRKMKSASFIKLKLPGHGVKNFHSSTLEQTYYQLPLQPELSRSGKIISYDDACTQLKNLLTSSVELRMVSDVPLGSFLSGGIDSSIVTGLAAQRTKHLNTFSIGFKDDPFFDETNFAAIVAKKFRTNHTVFNLSFSDLFQVLTEVLDYMDEPFADSSSLNVFLLSRYTRKHVTVALSGDGADEIFAGYNKHRAEWHIRNNKTFTAQMTFASAMLKPFQGSRQTGTGNKLRQLHRFALGAGLNAADRYWRWCSFAGERDTEKLFNLKASQFVNYRERKEDILQFIWNSHDLNDVLYTDTKLVLENDMLRKVDLMSMANSLEVRNPFLDYRIADFAFSLPSDFKIDKKVQKKILKDAFKDLLPPEILNRQKQGFEVPMLNWLRTDLKSVIQNELLSEAFINEQGLFNYAEVSKLQKQLFSKHPGDVHARIWALIVFQWWWRKYFSN